MKTIEESFKAEKEILEEFFKNRRIKEIEKKLLFSSSSKPTHI